VRHRQRGRDSNPRLTSLPATAFKAVPIGHSGTPPSALIRWGKSAGQESRPWLALLRSADLELDVVVGQVMEPLGVVLDVDQKTTQLRGQTSDVCGHQHL
jgi:hypothetical protein